MDTRPQLVPSIDALTDATALTAVLGRVDHVRVAPLTGVGFSNAALARVELLADGAPGRSFILKRTKLAGDWTACRTGDRLGREAFLLQDPGLAGIWDAFACPYVAYAVAAGEIGLLLEDLSATLFPDRREPLSDHDETAVLSSLARLHARHWGERAPSREWLVRPGQYCDMLASCVTADPDALGTLSPALKADVPRGWTSALARVPAAVARHLTRPGIEWERRWAGVPTTLLHGDAKVANFALLPGGRVAAFDWAVAGVGPCGIDLGWYLAVNASRLTGPKREVMSRYRGLLAAALGEPVGEPLWRRLEEVAAVCGARMLLWSKALAVDAGRAGAQEEWNWWVERLGAIPEA